MKKFILFSFMCLSVFLHSEKRALIIAIGHYPNPETNLWGEIASVDDVKFIKAALAKQGFEERNMDTLIDDKATRQGIVNALENFILKSGANDVCVIHISSHGVQLEDDDANDEVDLKDECIVPYGAKYTYDPNQVASIKGDYLRDDDFGALINKLRAKLGKGGDVLVTVDACHSGSATRGAERCRGNKPALLSPNAKIPSAKDKVVETHSEFLEKSSEGTSRGLDANANLATYIVMSAAQAEQPNWEIRDDNGQAVGPLSYSLYKALANNTDTNLTYRGLFASIQAIMNVKANRQQPVIEGDGKDREVFGGDIVKQEPYFEIYDTKSAGTALLKGGAILGLYKGSKIAFYKYGQGPGRGTAIDSGEIVASNNFVSTVKVSKTNAMYKKNELWAYITEKNYGDGMIKVFVKNVSGKAKEIKANLKDDMIEFTNDSSTAALVLDLWDKKAEQWALLVGNTDLPFDNTLRVKTPEDFEKIVTRIREYNQYLFLQELEHQTTDLNARLEILPIINGVADTNALNAKLDSTGVLELTDGDQVVLRITNTDKADAYINILDLMPTGEINPLMPCTSACPWIVSNSEMSIKSGKTVTLSNKVITISPPYGTEMLKVFVTREPIDLEFIKTTRGTDTKGGALKSSFEKYFKSSYKLTRGFNVTVDPDGTVFSLPFKIVERKLVAEKK